MKLCFCTVGQRAPETQAQNHFGKLLFPEWFGLSQLEHVSSVSVFQDWPSSLAHVPLQARSSAPCPRQLVRSAGHGQEPKPDGYLVQREASL